MRIIINDKPEWLDFTEEDLLIVSNLSQDELIQKLIYSALTRKIFTFFTDYPELDTNLQDELVNSIYLNFIVSGVNNEIILDNDKIKESIKDEFERRFS